MAKGTTASTNTSAYTKARQRLLLRDIEQLSSEVGQRTQAMAGNDDLWYGRRVKVFDGSGISMPDTPENQKIYPQPGSQQEGCGFPVMRIVAAFSLVTGALLGIAKDALVIHEATLFRRLWGLLETGDIVLADRGFCSYADFFYLAKRGIDCVMRNHQRRTVGLTVLKRFGSNDRLVEWHKMWASPKWLDREQWNRVPDGITVREITVNIDKPGFRTKNIVIVTTLIDPVTIPAEAFTQLYLKRWQIELYLRHIKITMGMDILRCKTPEMIHKELYMHLVAYNLIRAIMLEAAQSHGLACERLSFKGTVTTIRQWASALAQPYLRKSQHNALYLLMLYYIARDSVPYRPDRTEPRARKRRPRGGYQLMNKPRHQFTEIPHRSKYKKP